MKVQLLIAIRFWLPLLVITGIAVGSSISHPAGAATKPAAAAASPTAAPTAAPTAEPLDQAIPRLEAKVKADPNDRVSATTLATDYLQVNRPDLAVGLTQKLLSGGNKTAQVYFLDGAANANLGKIKEATGSLEQAANLEPTNIAVLQMLTTVYMRDNRPDDAERVAKRALTFNKDNKEAVENYGFVLAALKRYDEARVQFDTAAKLDPKDPHPVVLAARTYQDQNAIALAVGLYDRAIAIDPKSLEALVGRAQLAAAQHNVKDAVSTFETILKLQAQDFDRAAVVGEIAKVYAAEKMDSEADAAFRRAIESYPSVTQAHVLYGDYLASKNDRPGAEREWNLGLGANRDNPDAVARVAGLAMDAKDFTKAVEFYKRLIVIVPGDPRSHLLLGQAYSAARNFSAARDEFKQSYSIEHTPDALAALADADLASKNYTEAIQIFEALDKSAPELMKANPALLFGMGKAYQGVNQPQKARDAYARLLATLQPGSQNYNEVKGLIDGIDRGGRPAANSTPKPAPKPSSSPAPKR